MEHFQRCLRREVGADKYFCFVIVLGIKFKPYIFQFTARTTLISCHSTSLNRAGNIKKKKKKKNERPCL